MMARVIVGILQNPNPHRGQVYPLDGPVEFTYAEIAQAAAPRAHDARPFRR